MSGVELIDINRSLLTTHIHTRAQSQTQANTDMGAGHHFSFLTSPTKQIMLLSPDSFNPDC